MTGANANSAQCKYVQIQSNLWMVYQTGFWNVSYCQQLQHIVLFRATLNYPDDHIPPLLNFFLIPDGLGHIIITINYSKP